MSKKIGYNSNLFLSKSILDKSQRSLSKSFERISSGLRINSASDDAAGLILADKLKNEGRLNTQSLRNINDGISLLNSAETGIKALKTITTRIKELAIQASSDTVNSNQRNIIDNEAQALRDEFLRIIKTTEFNDKKLLESGELSDLNISIAGNNSNLNLDLGNFGASGTFTSNGNIAAGTNPFSLSEIDLNQDGNLDLVNASFGTNEVLVHIGNGNGTFQDAVNYSVGANPFGIEIGDVNNDGNFDILTANLSSNNVSILISNGDGTFQSATSYGSVPGVRTLELNDFNNDGNLDLLTASSSGDYMSVSLGGGDGTFSQEVTVATDGDPLNVTSGDFNGDGNLDIVSSNFIGDNLSVAFGNGDGSFQTVVSYASGNGVQDIETADLNNDGYEDIAVTSVSDNNVYIHLGNSSGTFNSVLTFATDTGANSSPFGISISDLDGDGNLDLAVGNETTDNISILIGNGDGSFKTPATYDSGDRVYDIITNDFNNDGISDIISSNVNDNNLSVFLGIADSGITPISEFSLKTKADAISSLTPLENKFETLLLKQAKIGANISRLQFSKNLVEKQTINLSKAESKIRDADIAFEVSNMLKEKIIQQATTSIMAQANLQSGLVLKLLQ